MAERRQSGSRPERAEHETGAAVIGEFGDRFMRQFRGAPVQFERAVGNAELAESDRRTPEAVGLQRVATRFEVAPVDLADQVRPAVVEDLGAVLEPEKVALDVEIARLHLRPHRAVAQHDAVGEVIEKMGHWRVYAPDSNSSPPRKRGSRKTASYLGPLDSRFRGNDGWAEELEWFRITPPRRQVWGRAHPRGGRSRRAGRRGSTCRNGIRARR